MSDYSEVLNFESLKFNHFDSSEDILTDKSFDPDLNVFNSNIGKLDTSYISHEEHKNDCNWTRTQNHLVLKGTLNHLAKLAK